MSNQIFPTLWFDDNAKQAFEYYAHVFPNVKIIEENPVVISALFSDSQIVGLNGGPLFKPNASISFLYIFQEKEQIDQIWQNLINESSVLMPLDQYPWSPYYGWLVDKFGFSWQFYLENPVDINQQKLVPSLMFSGEQQGKCEKALNFYRSIFTDFKSFGVLKYSEGEFEGQIQHSQFSIKNRIFMALDSAVKRDFSFNEAVSIVIECDDQIEIDYFWNAFTQKGKENRCGWCKDQFGISWQVVPKDLGKILKTHPNARLSLMSMNKIIVEDLVNA